MIVTLPVIFGSAYLALVSATSHLANEVLMVRPGSALANPETADSNVFQRSESVSLETVQAEFDAAVAALRNAGVRVHVMQDSSMPTKPDAVFPNNWVSFHAGGRAVLYPMLAPNRRLERSVDLCGLRDRDWLDLTEFEDKGRYLEGTGSLVLDHENRMAYAAISPRTDPDLAALWSRKMGYQLLLFETDYLGSPVYHTNVVMSLGRSVAVLCSEALPTGSLVESLRKSGREIIEISERQMECFAGNLLLVQGRKPRWILSERAWSSLEDSQRRKLAQDGEPCILAIDSIETVGGGSARCMICEVFR
ncbi:MAG: amidinotransferase [Armatimonadetes bacterium]|nr:amidinotransferase [Armatimonadota bacterium]